jgi:hypothetical protein
MDDVECPAETLIFFRKQVGQSSSPNYHRLTPDVEFSINLNYQDAKNWVKIIRENFFAKSPSAAVDSSYQLLSPFASFMIRVDCNKIINNKYGFHDFCTTEVDQCVCIHIVEIMAEVFKSILVLCCWSKIK